MKSLFCATSVAALMLATSGCAALTHYNSSQGAYGDHTTHFIDAKQRIVSTGKTRDRETGQELYMVCAEPSPDALSAIAAAQGLSLSRDDIQAAFSNSITEGAGSIGLRTQSIQLMRDSMYRLCEAHMSGFISDLAFETLHRRFQSSMVAILAIEQITSVARPPSITLGGISGGAGVDLVAESSELMLRADRDYKAAVEATKKAQEEYNTALKARDAKKEAAPAEGGSPAPETPAGDDEPTLEELEATLAGKKTALDDAKKREGELKEELEYFQSARRAALAGARTEIRVDIEKGRGPDPNEAERIAELSDTVLQIVQSTLTLSFSDELCTTLLVASANGQLYSGLGDESMQISDNQFAIIMPILQQTSAIRANLRAKEEQLGAASDAIQPLDPKSAGYDAAKAAISSIQLEIDLLYKELSDLEYLRSLTVGEARSDARRRGGEVIDECLRALRDRAQAQSDAQRDLLYAQRTWEYTKSDLLKATLQDNPDELVNVINALAALERATKSSSGLPDPRLPAEKKTAPDEGAN